MRDPLAVTSLALALVAAVALPGDGRARPPEAPGAVTVDGKTVAPPAAPRPAAGRKAARSSASPATPVEPAAPAVPPAADAVARARALLDAGQAAQAETLLRPYLDATPVDTDVRSVLAESLADQDRMPEATAQWEQVLRDRPLDDDTRLRLADAWLGLEQPDSALELYQQVLVRRPQDPSLRRRVGLLMMDQDRGADAIPHLEAYAALVPGDEEVLDALRTLYTWNDRPDDARRLLEQRVEAHPEDLDAVRELADRALDAGDEARAMVLYARIVKARPDDLAARRALGELCEWNGLPREALTHYEAYLDARPYDGEIRARALSLSSDLGLGARARRHGNLLRSSDRRFRDLARESVLTDTGLASWLGVEYSLFHERSRLWFHGVGPRGAWQVTDKAAVGAFYQFRYFRGPSAQVGRGTRTVLGHAVGAFAQLELPSEVQVALGASWNHYDTGFDSGNAHLVVSRDFEKFSIAAEFRRSDMMTGIGDLEQKIAANTLSLALDTEPVERLLLHAGGTWGILSDWNQRWSASAGVGVRVTDSPRFELWYEYDYEGFRYPGRRYANVTYFAPEHYHQHGPLASLTHAVKPWFAYGLDVHLWHVFGDGDNGLLLQVAPKVTFRPGGRHLLQASYQRTDEVWGKATARYQDDLLIFTYAYEF